MILSSFRLGKWVEKVSRDQNRAIWEPDLARERRREGQGEWEGP